MVILLFITPMNQCLNNIKQTHYYDQYGQCVKKQNPDSIRSILSLTERGEFVYLNQYT